MSRECWTGQSEACVRIGELEVYICVCVCRCRMRNVFCDSISGRDRGGSLDLVITVGRWFLIRVEIERFQDAD